jgi:DNA helicase HerA-like ATPase
VIGENPVDNLLTVISLRKSNQEIKKVIPLLLAKYYYGSHKEAVINSSPPDKTFHLIIDEAHNILSMQSNRESEGWKDYRLELFEEIIKEGRKFGFYLTLSSQRPADISATIMSQIHNFFIHRLVNDRDLLLLENSISTLDSLSRSMIPNLAKGCAIITGTSFDLPMVVQFKELPKEHQPDSDDVDLKKLWGE